MQLSVLAGYEESSDAKNLNRAKEAGSINGGTHGNES
jgi:hypothetical protein